MAAYVVPEASTPSVDVCGLYFNKQPREGTQVSKRMSIFYPRSALENANGIQFDLPPTSGTEMYVLQEAIFLVQVQLTKSDGTAIEAGKVVYPVNGIVNSLFDEVDLLANSCKVNAPGGMYGYKCYVRDLFNYTGTTKYSQLTVTGYHLDRNGSFVDDNNTGYESISV
jgi:hypothetical protein